MSSAGNLTFAGARLRRAAVSFLSQPHEAGHIKETWTRRLFKMEHGKQCQWFNCIMNCGQKRSLATNSFLLGTRHREPTIISSRFFFFFLAGECLFIYFFLPWGHMMDQLSSKVLVLQLSHSVMKCLCKSSVCMSVGTRLCLTFSEHLLHAK